MIAAGFADVGDEDGVEVGEEFFRGVNVFEELQGMLWLLPALGEVHEAIDADIELLEEMGGAATPAAVGFELRAVMGIFGLLEHGAEYFEAVGGLVEIGGVVDVPLGLEHDLTRAGGFAAGFLLGEEVGLE